jgi:hypothetical protein
MQLLTKSLFLIAILSLFPFQPVAQKSQRKKGQASTPPVICTIVSVPKGMVVVGYRRNSACSDGTQLLVKRPENGDIICAESPLPPHFSVVTEAQGNSIGTCPSRAFLISGTSRESGKADDDAIGRAFTTRASNIQVEGEGTVIRILEDDLNGPRHQRFIVEVPSGQTVLVTHNIHIAPRINGLEVGDLVRFFGEYVWNPKGGLVHWTHTDPGSKHLAGWLRHKGKTYQ